MKGVTNSCAPIKQIYCETIYFARSGRIIIYFYSIVWLLFSLLVSSCDEVFRNPYIKQIATNVEISDHWLEITPSSPLEVINARQHVVIKSPNFSEWGVDYKHEEDESILLKSVHRDLQTSDGQPLTIEVQVVAQDGTVFNMNTIGIGGGLSFGYYVESRGVIHPGNPTLPKEKKFSKVRIRASKLIQGATITWMCTTGH